MLSSTLSSRAFESSSFELQGSSSVERCVFASRIFWLGGAACVAIWTGFFYAITR
jgi:hypothetical protein